ncbi:MAG TPA: preprotein translocase subunit SecE [Pyrinomonadaceae bacterium]|nr:preprotein translocase subunit SecE [Pyrinomonadaceae bacterium]
MAKRFGKINVSEESAELETETAGADASGVPPAKVASGTRPGSSGDGGGRRPAKAAANHGFFARTAQFLRDTRAEMRRVSWPTMNMVKNTTIITLVAVIFFAIYLFAVDRLWSFLIDRLRGWLGG